MISAFFSLRLEEIKDWLKTGLPGVGGKNNECVFLRMEKIITKITQDCGVANLGTCAMCDESLQL